MNMKFSNVTELSYVGNNLRTEAPLIATWCRVAFLEMILIDKTWSRYSPTSQSLLFLLFVHVLPRYLVSLADIYFFYMDMKVNFVSMKDFVEINNEISSIVLLCYRVSRAKEYFKQVCHRYLNSKQKLIST